MSFTLNQHKPTLNPNWNMADLIDGNTRRWKGQLLRGSVHEEDLQLILQIPPSRSLKMDELV